MAEHEVLMAVAIDARKRVIEVTTLERGKGKHSHYPSIRQAPPELRGEALTLIREALRAAGYESLAELEAALTSEIVVPEKEADEAAGSGADEAAAAAGARRAESSAPAATGRRAKAAAKGSTASAGGAKKGAAKAGGN
jgi:hypothetical protein